MFSILLTFVAHAAVYASFAGLYLTAYPAGQSTPHWHLWVIVISSAIFVLITFLDLQRQYSALPTRCKTPERINSYMTNWLKSGGRVACLSRDLSWVNDENIEILQSKSKKGELVLCVQHDNAISRRLRKAGAKIFLYGATGYVPRSRFTITNFEREGARVAVAVPTSGVHTIHEFSVGQHPTHTLAEDLINLIIRQAEPS